MDQLLFAPAMGVDLKVMAARLRDAVDTERYNYQWILPDLSLTARTPDQQLAYLQHQVQRLNVVVHNLMLEIDWLREAGKL